MTRAYALEKLHESGDHGRNPFESARRARARPGDPDMRLEPDRFDIEATDSIDQAQTGLTARSASSSLLAVPEIDQHAVARVIGDKAV